MQALRKAFTGHEHVRTELTFSELEATAYDGDAEAQFILGSFYLDGTGGITQDYDKALKWFRKSLRQASLIFPSVEPNSSILSLRDMIYWL